jgi:hypothetical protein
MPRKMRVEYPGPMYHVISRGDQRDAIFLERPKGAKSNLHKWMKGPLDDASQPKLDIE